MSGLIDLCVNILFIWHPGFGYVDGAHWFLAVLIIIQFATAALMLFKKKNRYIVCLVIYLLLSVACIWQGFPRHGIIILLASEVKLLFGIVLYALYHQRIIKNGLVAIVGGHFIDYGK